MRFLRKLFGENDDVKSGANADVKRLKELPVVPSSRVPNSRHPNGPNGGSPGKEFTDPAELMRFLARKASTTVSLRLQSDCLVSGYRGGGCSTSLEVYRIDECTWRISEESEYFD